MTTEQKQEYKVLGTRPIRHDGTDKVTGRAQYGADLYLPRTIYGAILRSPHAHARILSIDTSEAESLPGVHAVVTSADMPEVESRIANLGETSVDVDYLSQNVLARDKVFYKGHAVAAVAAENAHLAEEAIRLIHVKYDPLPVVLSVKEAIKDNAVLLHKKLKTKSLGGETDEKPSNIAKYFLYEKGNLDEGFKNATVIVEKEFQTATVHQGYIEPHNATALWNLDGHLTVWTSTQGAFMVRDQLSDILDLPASRITVVPMEIGGGFGGKIAVYMQPVAAILSKKSGRPVKILMDRASCFEATGPTPGSVIKVKMGANAEGIITAAKAELYYEAGAYPGSPVNPGCMCIFACYDIPHAKVEGYDIVVNKPRTNAYRAPGATNAAFAAETVIDELCEKLEIDPIKFRLNNAAKEGTRRVDGPQFARIGMWETVDAIQNSEHAESRKDARQPYNAEGIEFAYGRGVASGFWFNAGLKSSVTAAVRPDGTVSLIEGSTDIGGTRTSIAMQLAETLGIAAEDVDPIVADTDGIGYTDVTGGSRTTYATGWAAYEAAKDIIRQLIARAAEIWDTDSENVTYENGTLHGPDNQSFTFKEFAKNLNKTGGPITGRGVSDHNEPGGAFATHLVDVAVDKETGKVEVVRYTAAQDVGKAIHPAYVEGQMQGGAVQGIGWALNEEYLYDENGAMQNPTFLDYRMPTCLDVPMIDTLIVEVPNPGHPYGVRGVGEVPIVPPPAAIANAIYDAVGIRMTELPMSPPRLLHELLK